MAWYNTVGKENDIILSSRVRFARNLAGFPFGSRLKDEQAHQIVDQVSALLVQNGFEKKENLSPIEALSYVEKHYISREFAEKKGPHALLTNDPCGYAVMVCEEDHLRMQCILPGLALDEAYASLCRLDDLMDAHFEVAFDERFGYLTHCPTNLGTGMRASVMMFLPALTMAGRIGLLASQLSKLGLTMRGLYGEGTSAQGNLYQISNQITLGLTEEDTIKKLSDVIRQICESERSLRKLINEEQNPGLVDRICRAEGILRHAFLLSSSEFISLYSDVRLGISLGIISGLAYEQLDELFVDVMPATLALADPSAAKGEKARDILRAKRIKDALDS
ncbi:MAG: protein arginine kinase [Clostridia bacterium]|nr:protein arginine kinase [Clostridia bacterium]